MIPLPEQIRAVWEATDAPSTEAAEARRAMTGLMPGTDLWTRYKLRAESADRDRKALLAAHATLSGLGEKV